MIREVFAQPLVPSLIDSPNGAELRIFVLIGLHKRHHAQIDAGKMRIGTEMIAHHHRTGAFQFYQHTISNCRAELGFFECSVYLGHEASSSIAAAQ